MPGLFSNLLRMLRDRRGRDMPFLCRHLLSERGEASQTVLAQEIINAYMEMDAAQRPAFFEMLCREFGPDEAAVLKATAEYQRNPGSTSLAALSKSVESPRQELFRRINTAPRGTETLVAMREHIAGLAAQGCRFDVLESDLRHLFRSWFNRGFLRLERISWQTSAIVLEKLIRYESVHEINGWPDLRRRLEDDRRCFAFFHPALVNEPIIFVEVALSNGLTGELEPLLDLKAPVLPAEKANTAIFYSINNCLKGLRGIAFGSFLIKQVIVELASDLPKIKNYSTLSPLPHFAAALREPNHPDGFTRKRLEALLGEFAGELNAATGKGDPVEAFFALLQNPLEHRRVLEAPLRRTALAYLTRARENEKLSDQVANFHLSNGARIERINAFGNLRPYGMQASFGVTVNYRYMPDDLEENHERFVRDGEIQIAPGLYGEDRAVAEAWNAGDRMGRRRSG